MIREEGREVSGVRTHRDLDVWRGAIQLAQAVYELTRSYPKEEMFGLSAQMRRAAVSVASNIAEGAARQGQKEFVHFLYLALGSASELDTQLEISRTTGMTEEDGLNELQALTERVAMMLQGLIRALKQRTS